MQTPAQLDALILRFFGLSPDAEFRGVLAALQNQLISELGFNPLPARQFHLTLSTEGSARKQRQPVEQAMTAAATLVRARTFELVFNRIKRFGGGGGGYSVALVPDENSLALRMLRESLRVAMLAEGFVIPRSGFNPHITLGYSNAIGEIDKTIMPIRWNVRDFVLIESHQGQTRHVELGRWELLP